MRYKRLLLLLVFAVLPTFAYQQQGFSNYQEHGKWVDFVCTGQCVLVLDAWSEVNLLHVGGQLQGQGMLGYGFLIWQQIAPGWSLQVNGEGILDTNFVLSDSPVFAQLPSSYRLAILVDGNVQWSQITFETKSYSLFESIDQWWNDFWKMETLTPYSINLRYGVMLGWVSLVKYVYILFILAALSIIFFVRWTKEKKYHKIFFLGIGMFLFIGVRNLITNVWIVHQWISSYTQPSPDDKTFFNLWDSIPFTDKIRKALDLDTTKRHCTIYVDSIQPVPFTHHRENVYLKPCTIVQTWSEADYLLYYYKKVPNQYLTKPVIVQFHGNYLLQNK